MPYNPYYLLPQILRRRQTKMGKRDRGMKFGKFEDTAGGAELRQAVAPKLRQAPQGPLCLRCGKAIALKRQGVGHGWTHDSCEQPMAPAQFIDIVNAIDFSEEA